VYLQHLDWAIQVFKALTHGTLYLETVRSLISFGQRVFRRQMLCLIYIYRKQEIFFI
jgi:hypothetical protein